MFVCNANYTKHTHSMTTRCCLSILEDDTLQIIRDEIGFVNYIDYLYKDCGLVESYIYGFDVWQAINDMLQAVSDSGYFVDIFASSKERVYYIDIVDRIQKKQVMRFVELSYMIDFKIMPDEQKILFPSSVFNIAAQNTMMQELQTIEAQIKDLCKFYNIAQEDLGRTIFSITGILRQYIKQEVASLKVGQNKLRGLYNMTARKNNARDFETWAMRHACFRGGLTYVNPHFVSKELQNVQVYDIKSVYHMILSSMLVPSEFRKDDKLLKQAVKNTLRQKKIVNWQKPFTYSFHAKIEIKNVRLRANKVPTLNETNFALGAHRDNYADEFLSITEKLRKREVVDTCAKPVFAFRKLIRAKKIVVHVTEQELWLIKENYKFSTIKVLGGEVTAKHKLPADLITLTSNKLFSLKERDKKYKILYNSLFGLLVQNQVRPHYYLQENMKIGRDDTLNIEDLETANFPSIQQWGIRVAGLGRVVLYYCLEELSKQKHNIYAADTDSIYTTAPPEEFMKIMENYHNITDASINNTRQHLLKYFKDEVTQTPLLGHWIHEKTYKELKILANKTRAGIVGESLEITAAGLPDEVKSRIYEAFEPYEFLAIFNRGLTFNNGTIIVEYPRGRVRTLGEILPLKRIARSVPYTIGGDYAEFLKDKAYCDSMNNYSVRFAYVEV